MHIPPRPCPTKMACAPPSINPPSVPGMQEWPYGGAARTLDADAREIRAPPKFGRTRPSGVTEAPKKAAVDDGKLARRQMEKKREE